jgi:hypothetical protein
VPERFVDMRLERQAYNPGDLLAGAFVVTAEPDDELTVVELSVLWHTAGKGDEDMGVVHFEDWLGKDGRPYALGQPQEFTYRLPETPLSYDGFLIKIHWCVRVRARWSRGKDTLNEVPFTLGNVSRPQRGGP